MSMLSQKIPAYNYEKSNLVRLILLTALFALVFINLYKPFSSSNWYRVSEFKFFVFSSLIILTGVLVVVVSRIIMYYRARRRGLSYGAYFFWILCEILAMSLFYAIYTICMNSHRDWAEAFRESVINTSLVLLLPYSVLWLYFSWNEKAKQLKQMEESHIDIPGKPNILTFYDEKGDLRLSVKSENLLYIESADNYVRVWYLNKGMLTRFMLRNTLKNIEGTLADTNILRCHRSYMVNFDQVKVVRREKDGIYLELGVEKAPDIPISKTYSEKVTGWFMRYSS